MTKYDTIRYDAPERRPRPDAREGVVAFRDRRAPEFAMRVSHDLPAAYPWWEPDEWSN